MWYRIVHVSIPKNPNKCSHVIGFASVPCMLCKSYEMLLKKKLSSLPPQRSTGMKHNYVFKDGL